MTLFAPRPGVAAPGLCFRIAAGGLTLFVWLLGCVCPAYADGAHIALRALSGPYSITLFTAPDPLVSGPADLSLLIEDAATGAVLSEVPSDALFQATTDGVLTCPGAQPVRFTFSHEAATNKLLLAANPTLPQPGTCTLVLHIRHRGSPTVSVTTVLQVAEDHRRRTLLLFALVLPLAIILLFLVNQQAKFRRGSSLSTLPPAAPEAPSPLH